MDSDNNKSSLKQRVMESNKSSQTAASQTTTTTTATATATAPIPRGGGRGRGRGLGRGRSQSRGGGRGGGGGGRGRTSPNNAISSSSSSSSFTNNINTINNTANDNASVVQQTNSKTEMPVCTFYLAGRCNFGAKCRFYHPPTDSESLTEKQQQQLQQQISNNTNNNAGGNDANSYKPNSKAPREFDAFKAEAINMAKTAQDLELNQFAILKGPFYSMDIECVASGYGHTDKQRYPCRVSLVKDRDGNGDDDQNDVEVLLDEIVNLNNVNVVNYMTPLTGMTAEQCLDPSAKDLDEIRSLVKSYLSVDSILVGHSIQHDVEWLGLVPGVDFKQGVDTSCFFRQRIPRNLGSAGNILRGQVNGPREGEEKDRLIMSQSESNLGNFDKDDDGPDDTHLPFPTKYRLFSLRHCCIHLLNVDIQEKAHNPIMDAKYSLLLFRKYQFASPELLRVRILYQIFMMFPFPIKLFTFFISSHRL